MCVYLARVDGQRCPERSRAKRDAMRGRAHVMSAATEVPAAPHRLGRAAIPTRELLLVPDWCLPLSSLFGTGGG